MYIYIYTHKIEIQDMQDLFQLRFFHKVLTGWIALETKPDSSSRSRRRRRSSEQTRKLPVAKRGPRTKSPESNCDANVSAAFSVVCHIKVSNWKSLRNCLQASDAGIVSWEYFGLAAPCSSQLPSVSLGALALNDSMACSESAGLLAAVYGKRCSKISALRLEDREVTKDDCMTPSNKDGHSNSHVASNKSKTVSSPTTNVSLSIRKPTMPRNLSKPPGKSRKGHSLASVLWIWRKSPETSAKTSTSTCNRSSSMITSTVLWPSRIVGGLGPSVEEPKKKLNMAA